MQQFRFYIIAALIGLSACSTPKSFFTVETRNKLEEKSIPVGKLQFYVDKDVELRRELSSSTAKVSSGKVIMENGKYLNIILLKAGTLGVCTQASDNKVDIAFEKGDGKTIPFSVSRDAASNAVYTLSSEKWFNNYNSPEVGKITYDGEIYFMRFAGARPKLLIKKIASDKYETDKRTMKGRKVN